MENLQLLKRENKYREKSENVRKIAMINESTGKLFILDQ
jgi:hypothetical protein